MKAPDTLATPGKTRRTSTALVINKFRWRALVSVFVFIPFAILRISGASLWFTPPGRIANWTNWTLFGLRKVEWANLRIWFALVFVAASGFHIVLNWGPLKTYPWKPITLP